MNEDAAGTEVEVSGIDDGRSVQVFPTGQFKCRIPELVLLRLQSQVCGCLSTAALWDVKITPLVFRMRRDHW